MAAEHAMPHPPYAMHADAKRKYGADAALTAVSGAALGSLCSYLREHGTQQQSEQCGRVVDSMLELQRQTSSAKRPCHSHSGELLVREQEAPPGEPDWLRLRQELYELAGDWLWSHACHHFRTAVAPRMCLPLALREEALRVAMPIEYSPGSVGGGGCASRGYVSFGDFEFPGSDSFFEEKPSEPGGGAGILSPRLPHMPRRESGSGILGREEKAMQDAELTEAAAEEKGQESEALHIADRADRQDTVPWASADEEGFKGSEDDQLRRVILGQPHARRQ